MAAGPTVTLNFAGDVDELSRATGMAAGLVNGVAAAGVGAAAVLAGIPLLVGGIGIAAAAQNAEVQASFTGLKDHVWAETQAMAAPIVPTLLGISDRIRTAFDASSGSIGRMFAATTPYIDLFADGLLGLVTNILPGFEDILNNAAPVAEAFSTGLANTGTALSTMFSTISGSAPGAANGLTMVFDIINFLIVALGHVMAFSSDWSAVLIPLGIALIGLHVAVALTTAGIAAYNGIMAAVRIGTAAWAGVQWLLNAAMSANPIGIIIIAIAALVAGIIWAYNNFEGFRNVVNNVWSSIQAGTAIAVNAVIGIIGWFQRLPGMVGGWFNDMANGAIARATGLVNFVRGIPGMIMGAIGNLGSLLLGAGRALIDGFVNGIRNAVGNAIGVVTGFIGRIRNLFPFSPAKEGPFSGRGYTLYSGLALATDFAKGIDAGTPDILGASTAAVNAAAGPLTMAPGTGAASARGGGGRTVEFAGNLSDALATLIMMLIRTGKIRIN